MKEVIEAVNAMVRPVVSVALTAGVLYGFVVDKISGDTFMAIVSMVLGFWFMERKQAKE